MCQRTFAIGGSRRQSVGSRSRPQHDANTDRRVSPGAASALLSSGGADLSYVLSFTLLSGTSSERRGPRESSKLCLVLMISTFELDTRTQPVSLEVRDDIVINASAGEVERRFPMRSVPGSRRQVATCDRTPGHRTRDRTRREPQPASSTY